MKKTLLIISLVFAYSTISASDIALVSMAIGKEFKETVKSGLENKKQYCKEHGYDFICGEESLDPSRPLVWSKILLIQQVLENPKYRWVFWSDADSLIMNTAVCLEDFIDENYNLILTKSDNSYNFGQFFLQNTDWSKNFLGDVYSHTECINHIKSENMAMTTEIESNADLKNHTKVLPARLMNSTICNTLKYGYKKGDFIIHFAGCHDPLGKLMNDYSKLVVDDKSLMTLDYYHGVYGYILHPSSENTHNEGFITNAQMQQIKTLLLEHPEIKKVAEIGLNGGHSANVFFQNLPNLKKFTSFDIFDHGYVEASLNYFKRFYKDQFEFVKGSSIITVPLYTEKHPSEIYDLLYVDGNHTYEYAYLDVLNFKALAYSKTLLLVDDVVMNNPIHKALLDLQTQGHIKIDNIFHSYDGESNAARDWALAHYIFN